MVVASGILFSDFWGFLYAWMGTLSGASGAFYIARTLGREFIEPFLGKRAMKYDSMIRENGFTAVLYMRLLQLPFTPLNFCLGLTAVRFRDYLSGTAIGVLTGLFVFYYLGRTLRGIFVTGNWGQLLSLRFLAAFSILLFSLAIPTAIKRYKKKFT